ncbi:putative fatty acid-coA racemase [Streptomyces scabiei 87.22]|uniref:Putative fatty acid-coA racemase n=1 Tax=Streptomyces scabiei (strain 87.22) TaxID=680198 RepID=C9Z867_STRSW|nr:CaiB/BaiF CoA-transferase family protein [Streptomyces scabiei]MDX2574811.1 CaiB/BaiF CoA-transferase family protein [Streptomyces scabiei]MDX2651575.1 CaiB/BaiF CoA-transferase family protein [Streptomyces scabiei]MDX2722894.1 CaiB/BaiF CoA-transferase family protein [Streptomyces scabiei]MDX2865981.1 CaiB/BaiF CoA-transferase family protein [Streptomyces scabiei]MDX2884855.1 CaiB/BaiF CoA-transferase family protein [Streptomyces scabiei]
MTEAKTPGHGPLAGVRVVELAGIGPGPFAAMLLADLGADVVRVDRPGGTGLAVNPLYDVTNRNKRSVLVDLKSPAGPDLVLDLAERADILIEGYRPGVAERLGVGPATCHARNPALVYGRMTGWGQQGPLAQRAGHDIAYIAPTGALGMIGAPDTPPPAPANLLGDYAGGSLYLVVGVLAALHHARATGTGQVVDAAIVDGTAHLSAMLHGMLAAGRWQDRRAANLLDGGCPFYGTYETADGRYMAVGALEQQFYDEFVELLGIADRAPARKDVAAWDELRATVAARFATRTRDEWTAVFEGSDACVAPVLSLGEAPHHTHLAARGTFTDFGGITQPAPAPRFSATPTSVRSGPAQPGADTADVAHDWGIPGLTRDARAEAGASPGVTAADAAASDASVKDTA